MRKDSIDKFTGNGFHTWQSKPKGYLMKKNLWGVVKPLSENERMETRSSMAKFQEKDEQAETSNENNKSAKKKKKLDRKKKKTVLCLVAFKFNKCV